MWGVEVSSASLLKAIFAYILMKIIPQMGRSATQNAWQAQTRRVPLSICHDSILLLNKQKLEASVIC
jgi:hypothetical protein